MTATLKIVAIQRQGQFCPPRQGCSKPVAAPAFERQRAEQRHRQLQAMCLLSPELERCLRTAERHQRRGNYSRNVLIRDIERYVVEPAAIELTATQPDSPQPWFRTYPPALRTQLAERLALVVEQQVLITTSEDTPLVSIWSKNTATMSPTHLDDLDAFAYAPA